MTKMEQMNLIFHYASITKTALSSCDEDVMVDYLFIISKKIAELTSNKQTELLEYVSRMATVKEIEEEEANEEKERP